MMDSFLILATEAHSAVEGGIGLNLDILETNVLNLIILLGLLVFYGRKVLGQILGERRSKISQAIQEAEESQREAKSALAQEQQNLAQAQAEAERIRQTAQERAARVSAEIAAQSERDVDRLREMAAADLSTEQERVIAQLKKQIAQMAVARAENQIKERIDDNAQQRLIDRSIAQLGGHS